MTALHPVPENAFCAGYRAAQAQIESLPGPILTLLIPRILNASDDPTDDPQYAAGFRQALRDTHTQQEKK